MWWIYMFRKENKIEIDGSQHKEENQEKYDKERTAFWE
jgi:very-short-patch-repair endonuclease